MITSIRRSILYSVVVCISVLIIYGLTSKPTELPSTNEVKHQIQGLLTGSKDLTVQERILLDKQYLVAPFVTKDEEYGLSYWRWSWFRWKLVQVSANGEPVLLKLKGNHPEGYYVVWNIHPEDRVTKFRLYIIQKRYYAIDNGKHLYIPGTELYETLSTANQTYGMMQIPEIWQDILRKGDGSHTYLGWIPLSEEDKVIYPSRSVNGGTYSQGKLNRDFIRFINPGELEGEESRNLQHESVP